MQSAGSPWVGNCRPLLHNSASLPDMHHGPPARRNGHLAGPAVDRGAEQYPDVSTLTEFATMVALKLF